MALTKISTPELFDFSATNTALQLPTGPTTGTGGRPATPSTGEWRFNTTEKYVEYYDGGEWRQIDTESTSVFTPSENFNVNTYFGNSATQKIDAKFNEAANFNGSSSVIDISLSAINPASPYTISMWFNASNAASYEGLYTGISSSPVVGEITIVKNNATTIQTFSVATNGSNTLDANTITVPTLSSGTWYNLVVIADRSLTYKSRLFINGVEGTNYTVGSASTNLLSTIKIGFADNNYFDGKIDQVRFFNTALTNAQAEDCFTDETTTTAATLNFPAGAGCFAAYQLDGNGNDIDGNYSGTTTDIGYTGLNFKPDLIWLKETSGTDRHILIDSVRGKDSQISSQSNAAETEFTSNLTSFDTNGFTLGSASESNGSNDKYVAWCWKAGGAASDITSSSSSVSVSERSANAAAGFSIVTYTVNAITQVVLPHGLDSTPELAIVKKLDSPGSWLVYNTFVSGKGRGFLNTDVVFDNSSMPTIDSTNITFLAQDPFDTGNSAVIYFFADISGYQKIGSYEGTGDNTLRVYTTDDGSSTGANGFQPSFVMIKRIDGGNGNWVIIDELRASGDSRLYANLANGEDAGQGESFISNGFKPRQSSTNDTNIDGSFYLYLAIK